MGTEEKRLTDNSFLLGFLEIDFPSYPTLAFTTEAEIMCGSRSAFYF